MKGAHVWINDGTKSHPDPDNLPLGTTVAADAGTTFKLPKASITVLRGKLAGSKD